MRLCKWKRLFAMLLIGCLAPACDNARVRAQSSDTNNCLAGRIVLIAPKEPKPGLRVRQSSGVAPVDAVEGMLVRRGQLLFLEPSARATIVCGDGSKHDLMPGFQGVPCKVPCMPEICGIRLDGGTIRLTRGGDTDNSPFPIIISPRRGFVLDTRPGIRWSAIAGANDDVIYTVKLYGENQRLMWSREVVGKTELEYPKDAPALAPGAVYLVLVSADRANSDQEDVPDRGFTVLTVDEAKALDDRVRQIQKLELPEPQTRFLIATLYATRELYAEAIDILESSGSLKGAAASRTLGDLYLAVGLNREAEWRYLKGLSLLPENELEDRALGLSGLVLAYQNLADFDQAIARLAEAIDAYKKLGDSVMVYKLTQQRNRLKQ